MATIPIPSPLPTKPVEQALLKALRQLFPANSKNSLIKK